MSLFDLFNVRSARPAARPPGATLEGLETGPPSGPQPAAAAPREGVFITRQSLASFAGASFVVTLLNQIAGVLVPAWKNELVVPFVIALIVGAVVFMINELDPEKFPRTARDWTISVFIAFVNSVVLWHAAMGAGTYLGAK